MSRRPKVDNREFVVTFIRSETTQDVAKTLGMTPGAVAARAAYLRKQGVKLPKMTGRRSKLAQDLEVAKLNSLIKKHLSTNS